MRAITIRQPWLWAICRGGKTVENRSNKRGMGAALAQFRAASGRAVLLHASTTWDGDEAYRTVRNLSSVDPSDSPKSDTAWFGEGGFVADAVCTGVHTAADCYDPVSGRMCSPWAEENAAHLVLADVRVLFHPVPYKGALGLWTVDDTTVLAQVRRQLA